ncbi:MAG: rod-binding protein [Beijerinckiaceae bacterium]
MSVANSIPAKRAYEAYLQAAKAKPGTREQKTYTAAQNFEATFLNNILENMTSGLGEEGPLGAGKEGGGAWKGFLMEEMSKGMSKSGTLGIAPQVYRQMLEIQEGRGG